MKRVVFAVVPVLVLIFGVECAQRVRYAVRSGRVDPLWYGLSYFRDVGPAGESSARPNPAATNGGGAAPAATNGGGAAPAAVAQQVPPGGRVILVPRRGPPGCPTDMSPTARVILTVGGSSTFGVFNDENHTYPYLLQQAMNTDVGHPAFVVCNLGVSGMGSAGYGKLIEDELRHVTPRLVIVYTGYNDTYADLGPYRTGFGSSTTAMGQWLHSRSLLWLTASEKFLLWYEQWRPRYRDPSVTQQRLENLRASLMAAVGRLRGKHVDVLLVPEVVMDNTVFEGLMSHPDLGFTWFQQTPGVIRDVAAASGSEFVSLQDGFSKKDFSRFFRDPVHLTDDGNRRLVELLLMRSRLLQDFVRTGQSQAGPGEPARN